MKVYESEGFFDSQECSRARRETYTIAQEI